MNYNPFSLEGKKVLITGASSGIGRATAVECSKMGAKVVITGRDEDRLSDTYNILEGEGHQAFIADLTSQEDVDHLVMRIDSLDGLVNNAGIGRNKPVGFIKMEDLESVYRTNVYAGILLTKSLLKKKKINKYGSLVFTSSISSLLNTPGIAIYASSKAAITSFMRSCAVELGEKGIRSNAVLPGMVETNLIRRGDYTEEDMARDKSLYALRRYGKPEEIAHAIIYLLSDASSWVTGTSLVIDGGRMLK